MRFVRSMGGFGLAMAALLGMAPGWARAQGPQEPPSLDPEEVMALKNFVQMLNTKVLTASNTEERLKDAPATLLVLTQEDLLQRGYLELSEILDDLPGLDVIRPYGDAYVKAYWRGYRNTWGDPFLVMVDGIPLNHLWYNSTDGALVPLPLANVQRVEVVYGPASSVFGANAMMGVVNVITRKAGPQQRGALTTGKGGRRLVDYSFLEALGEVRVSLSARIDNGRLDDATSEHYEYTKNRYYQDPALWGGFLGDPALAGPHRSEFRNRGLDLRIQWGGTELGLLHQVLDSGYGNEYAADLAQNRGRWARVATGFHLRHTQSLWKDFTTTTLIRRRDNDIRNDSTFLDTYFDPGQKQFLAAFSWWQVLNSGWSLNQDFDWRPSESWGFNAGLRYEQRTLQRGSQSAYGPYVPVGRVDLRTYPFPAQPTRAGSDLNHIVTEEEGIYVQARMEVRPGHRLVAGGRYDHQSEYGPVTTLRAGYLGVRGPWQVKALFGQAYQAPTPRTLYGSWSPGGSNPDLRPEHSKTLEFSAAYTTKGLSLLLNPWRVDNRDTIVTGNAGARNVGARRIQGADLHLQALLPPGPLLQWKVWGFASRLFTASETKFAATGSPAGEGFIGDLSRNKLWFGTTVRFTHTLDATLRGRWMEARRAVDTNPLGTVPGFTVLDLTLNARYRGLGFSLQVGNLTDRLYFHPGYADANAGDRPGAFDGNGNWVGSGGYYSSLLAQPGRTVSATLRLQM